MTVPHPQSTSLEEGSEFASLFQSESTINSGKTLYRFEYDSSAKSPTFPEDPEAAESAQRLRRLRQRADSRRAACDKRDLSSSSFRSYLNEAQSVACGKCERTLPVIDN